MLKKWLPFKNRSRPFEAPIAPSQPFIAIGDIHGCADLLKKLLKEINQSMLVVCVGDYIDRGTESSEVLRFLSRRSNTICLGGNHEDMMLNFINAPHTHGARWMRFGGLETLASFGIKGMRETASPEQLLNARDALVQEMGQDLLKWLGERPTHWQTGNVTVAHAGADPKIPISVQQPDTFRWGHPDFTKSTRQDDVWVIHGHTIVDTPTCDAGRIAIDTGAYATGRLTAAVVDEGGVQFITT